jgi:DNA repair protein RadC
MNTRTLKKHLKYKIPQIKLAIIREPSTEPLPAITTPQDIEPYLEPMRHMPEENFLAMHLNARHEVIGYHIVSHGTLSSSLVHPREVFKAALLSNAHTLIVAHNHPSGSSHPSREDLDTTRQLVAAGNILGVSVLDHLIVTFSKVISIRESYPDIF